MVFRLFRRQAASRVAPLYEGLVRASRRPVFYAVTPRLRDQASEVAQNHPQPMVEVYDGAGHALFVDEAARFNASMEEFLSRRAAWG